MMAPTLAVTNVAKVDGKIDTGDTAEAAGELLRMRQSQASMAASRTNGQGDASDVGSVVSKAKRAASSLWLILHAQTCRLASDQCPHTGCDDAKLILLHIKTCPAENCSECPVQYKGCQQSRKLLDHYRKCRDMRARQAGGSRRAQPHVCLVCSLVARQARNVLDGAVKSTPPPTTAHKAASGSRKAMASFSLKQPAADKTVTVPRLDSSELKQDMPPPPPRAPNATEPMAIPSKKEIDADAQMDPCESPPSSYQLMRPGLAALAAAASPSLQEAKSAADASLLGKSLDSSKISFLLDASQSKPTLPAVSKSLTSPSRRPRSESVDVASVSRASHQPGAGSEGYDPTLESELTREADMASVDKPKKNTRRRSASLGGLNSYESTGSPCDTIVEETVTTDEPMFLMEEETNI